MRSALTREHGSAIALRGCLRKLASERGTADAVGKGEAHKKGETHRNAEQDQNRGATANSTHDQRVAGNPPAQAALLIPTGLAFIAPHDRSWRPLGKKSRGATSRGHYDMMRSDHSDQLLDSRRRLYEDSQAGLAGTI